jgi:hypothetical protein
LKHEEDKMKFGFSKIAIAVVCLQGSINLTPNIETEYFEDKVLYSEVVNGLTQGWSWGTSKADACDSACYGNRGDDWDGDRVGAQQPPDYGDYDPWGDYDDGWGNYDDNGSDGGGGPSNEQSPVNHVYDPENVGDAITNLIVFKNNLTKALATTNLTPQAIQKIQGLIHTLNGAISKANILVNLVNSGAQTGVHIAEGDFGAAIAEVAALAVGLGISVVASGPVTGIVISFAAASFTEWAVEETIDAVGQMYDTIMYEYENNSPSLQDIVCSYVMIRKGYCAENLP